MKVYEQDRIAGCCVDSPGHGAADLAPEIVKPLQPLSRIEEQAGTAHGQGSRAH